MTGQGDIEKNMIKQLNNSCLAPTTGTDNKQLNNSCLAPVFTADFRAKEK